MSRTLETLARAKIIAIRDEASHIIPPLAADLTSIRPINREMFGSPQALNSAEEIRKAGDHLRAIVSRSGFGQIDVMVARYGLGMDSSLLPGRRVESYRDEAFVICRHDQVGWMQQYVETYGVSGSKRTSDGQTVELLSLYRDLQVKFDNEIVPSGYGVVGVYSLWKYDLDAARRPTT